jgi:hypothetical protein
LFVFIAGIYGLYVLFVISRLWASPRPLAVDREDFVAMPFSATRGLDLDPRSDELIDDAPAPSDTARHDPA